MAWRYVMVTRSGRRTLSDREYTTAAGAAAAGARWAEGGTSRSVGVQEGPTPGARIEVDGHVVTCGFDGQPAHCTCLGYMYSKPHTCRHLERLADAA